MLVGGLWVGLGWAGQGEDEVPGGRAEGSAPGPTLILAVGAGGEAEYRSNFVAQAERWRRTAETVKARVVAIGLGEAEGSETDGEQLRRAIEAEAKGADTVLWVVLIGHGTYDGREARFNVRGPDLSATELAAMLKPVRRRVVVVNTAAASAPFVNALSGTNRVVISATRSGSEVNFARFGGYFGAAIADRESDLDRDGQVSVLEAFLMAARRVAEFYRTEGRLATEHALLDDNGDGLGTPAEWYRGVRAVRKARAGAALDGVQAHQIHLVPSREEQQLSAEARARRDALEVAIARLREGKESRPEEAYYAELERLLVELARLVEGGE